MGALIQIKKMNSYRKETAVFDEGGVVSYSQLRQMQLRVLGCSGRSGIGRATMSPLFEGSGMRGSKVVSGIDCM